MGFPDQKICSGIELFLGFFVSFRQFLLYYSPDEPGFKVQTIILFGPAIIITPERSANNPTFISGIAGQGLINQALLISFAG